MAYGVRPSEKLDNLLGAFLTGWIPWMDPWDGSLAWVSWMGPLDGSLGWVPWRGFPLRFLRRPLEKVPSERAL